MGEKTGPTGKFPRGKACPDDEGEIALRIGTANGGPGGPIVIIDFGVATKWIGFPPEQVDQVCEQLQSAKKKALERKGN